MGCLSLEENHDTESSFLSGRGPLVLLLSHALRKFGCSTEGAPPVASFYFSRESTIAVIAVTPVSIAGAYTGAKKGECKPDTSDCGVAVPPPKEGTTHGNKL